MGSPAQAREDVLALLLAITNLHGQVHDGEVPDDIPTDSEGYVLPYVVLWSNVGNDLPAERDLTRLADTRTRDLVFQTQVVGATRGIVLAASEDVRNALLNRSIGGGWLLPDDRAFDVAEPIREGDVTPSRYFMPLRWRLLIT